MYPQVIAVHSSHPVERHTVAGAEVIKPLVVERRQPSHLVVHITRDIHSHEVTSLGVQSVVSRPVHHCPVDGALLLPDALITAGGDLKGAEFPGVVLVLKAGSSHQSQVVQSH